MGDIKSKRRVVVRIFFLNSTNANFIVQRIPEMMYVENPINKIKILQYRINLPITFPSFPLNPTVLQPRMTLAGAITLPKAPPAVCAARIKATERFKSLAVCIWRLLNNTLELLLLPVINAPNAPMKGETIG